jgi:hypothetical protein
MVQSAAAYWTANGTGSGSGHVGTLGAPTISSATPGSGKATLTWTAVTPPGSGSVSYYALRDGGSPAGNCPTQAAPTSVLTCTDVGLSLGTHTYTVTAVYHSWTARSSLATVTIVTVPTAAFSSGPALGSNNWLPTFVSGSGFNAGPITISWSYAWSGYTYSTTTPADGSGNFAWNGLENCVDGYNVYHTTDQTVTVTATDGTQTAIGTGILRCSLRPNPAGGPAGAASKLAFTQSPGNAVAGVAFASQPQVTVQDQYGNTVTSDASTVTLTSSGPGSVTGCSQSESNGVVTFSGCKITTAGTYTLTATDGSLTSATSSSFIVSPAAASKLAFTAQPTNTVAGVAITPAVTVTVQDADGNPVTSGAGSTASVTIAIGTNPGGGTLSGTKTVAAVAGVATFSGLSIDHVSTGYTLTAASTGLAGATSGTFNITAGAANKLAFTAQPPGTTVAGVAFATQPQVTVQDQYGNTVTTDSSSVTIAVTGVTPPPVSGCAANPNAASGGIATFSGCTITTAGTYTLTATDGSLTATSGSFTISAAGAKGIVLSSITTNTSPAVCSGSIGAITCSSTNEPNGSGNFLSANLTLEDQFGNVVVNSGSSIEIDLAIDPTINEGDLIPTTNVLWIAGGSSTTSASFTLTRTPGNGRSVKMTATVIGPTPTQTLTVTLSS